MASKPSQLNFVIPPGEATVKIPPGYQGVLTVEEDAPCESVRGNTKFHVMDSDDRLPAVPKLPAEERRYADEAKTSGMGRGNTSSLSHEPQSHRGMSFLRGRQQEDPHIRKLKDEVEKGNGEHARAEAENAIARENLHKVATQLQKCQAELGALQTRKLEAEEGVRYLKQENLVLQRKLQKFEDDLKRNQEKSIRDMDDGRWGPIPDDLLRDRLNNLQRDIRDWAKRWAVGRLILDSLSKSNAREYVETYLSRFVRVTDGHLPGDLERPRPKMEEKVSSLLLTAALAHEIQTQFFQKPFFCFDTTRVQALEDIHRELMKANPREAHIWRSIMWRIMNPLQNTNRSQRNEDISRETLRRRQSLCDWVAAEFVEDVQLLLKAQETEDARKERAKTLRDILMHAAEIATSLLTQRPYLLSQDLHAFRFRKESFNIRSQVLEAHPLSRVDADDLRHNGRKISIVVRPALLAFEEDDDKGYDGNAFRVLATAIVYLDE